jgi:[acyl-carrier-protein] S-malonyltransferase
MLVGCQLTMVMSAAMKAERSAQTNQDVMPPSPTAIVFPGQGSQRQGMGRDFREHFEPARLVYEEASEALGLDLWALCVQGDGRLNLTEYAQPAILATEIAMLRAVEVEFGLSASYFGGHSLGEYTALVASGALPLGDAVRVVRERGRLMQDAVPVGRGRMIAVISDHLDLSALQRAIDGLEVNIANDNSSSQVVLSGRAEDTRVAERQIEAAVDGTSVRFVELDVSAPFHSPLMAVIEPRFREVLEGSRGNIDAPRAAFVTSNFTGGFHDADTSAVIDRLVRQISGTVRWRSNMEALAARSARVIEIGPGRPLRAFFKTLGVEVQTITDVRSANRVAMAVMAK